MPGSSGCFAGIRYNIENEIPGEWQSNSPICKPDPGQFFSYWLPVWIYTGKYTHGKKEKDVRIPAAQHAYPADRVFSAGNINYPVDGCLACILLLDNLYPQVLPTQFAGLSLKTNCETISRSLVDLFLPALYCRIVYSPN